MIKKTALITAGSVVGVVLAAGAAIGANVGILAAADNTNLGNLSAEVDQSLLPPSQNIDIATPLSTGLATDPSDPKQTLAPSTAETTVPPSAEPSTVISVEGAGTVEVSVNRGRVILVNVTTNPGWSYTKESLTSGSLVVRFQSGNRTVWFEASPHSDGTVDHQITGSDQTSPTGVSPPPTTAPGGDQDDDQDDDQPTSTTGATTTTVSAATTTVAPTTAPPDHGDDGDSHGDDHHDGKDDDD